MNNNDIANLIKNRRHGTISKKLDIWKLIKDSYAGGSEYKNGNYLIRYPRENIYQYEARKERAVYFNHVAPLVDLLTGFIIQKPVIREFPEKINYFIEQASKGKTLDTFMQRIITNGMLYTCGILIDCEKFDAEQVKTQAQRKELNLYPYGVLYYGWEIRDYETDNNNELEWILLDNSYEDKSDPYKQAQQITLYRLWTKKYYQDFEYKSENNKSVINISEPIEHKLGIVPFIFVNFRDIDDDYISEGIFEDISIIDKSFYNLYSCMDELLVSGSFKTLFYPIGSPQDIPAEMISSGVGELPVVTYKGDYSAPNYSGPGIGETTGFIEALKFLIKEMFIRVGLDTDNERSGVQSGEAKRLEFKKTESILVNIAEQLEHIEKKMLELVCRWEGITNYDINIVYDKNYINNELSDELNNLYQAMNLPIRSIQSKAIKRIAEKTFNEELEKEDLDAINEYLNKEYNPSLVINEDGNNIDDNPES